MEATITLEYDDARTAKAIASAVSPDNHKTPKGLFIKTVWKEKQILTSLKYEGKLATFIATIDDLLFSAATAEKTLRTIEREEEPEQELPTKKTKNNSHNAPASSE